MAVEVFRIRDRDGDNPKAMCKLDCGLMGMLFADSFDDYDEYGGELRTVDDGGGVMVERRAKSKSWQFDELRENAVIYVLVQDVTARQFKIKLTAKQTEIDKWNRQAHQPIGIWPYYRAPLQSSLDSGVSGGVSTLSGFGGGEAVSWLGAAMANKASAPTFIKRDTAEKVFVNKTKADVVSMFAQQGWDIGYACFRPSSQGTHLLKATVRFFEDLYADYTIYEDGKEFANPAKPTLAEKRKLGTKLTVGHPLGKDPRYSSGDQSGQPVYDSLEELQFSYFQELIDIAEQVTSHRKYLEGGRNMVEVQCNRDKTANPQSFPYYLCVSKKHPGFFELGYLSMNKSFRYLYIQPLADGLKCAGVMYFGDKAINAIVSEFKKNPRKMYAREVEEKRKIMQLEEERRRAEAAKRQEAERRAAEERRQREADRQMAQQSHVQPQPGAYGGGYGGGGAYGGPGPQQWQQPVAPGYGGPRAPGYDGGGSYGPPSGPAPAYGGGYGGGGYGAAPPQQQWQPPQQAPPPVHGQPRYAPPPAPPQQQWSQAPQHAGEMGGYGGY